MGKRVDVKLKELADVLDQEGDKNSATIVRDLIGSTWEFTVGVSKALDYSYSGNSSDVKRILNELYKEIFKEMPTY